MSRSHPDNLIQKRQRRARLLHSIYSWHRWMGLSILLWVLMWASTGLLIEASPALGLDRKTIRAPWLMQQYGIASPNATGQWRLGNVVLDEWDQGISHRGQWLKQNSTPIIAATAVADVWLIADAQGLQLYSADGSWIDQLSPPPGTLHKLGSSQNQTVIAATSSGLYENDEQWLAWNKVENSDATWGQKTTAEPTADLSHQRPAAAHDISVERVLLDIHSGTLFGPVGRWLSRLAAVVMMLLALSGFYTWFTRFMRRR